jgi:Xaa-Pro aminopeptidase
VLDLQRLQAALTESALDGWLFFDHHRRDPIAYRILDLPADLEPSRRWYYLIPASGPARKLVHRIETGSLDSLPGEKDTYASWSDQQSKLRVMLSGCSRIAMQYSANCAIPYVSLVDAGTLELVRSSGIEVVTSADLVQDFEARWSEEQARQHFEAGRRVDRVRGEAFALIKERVRNRRLLSEYEVQQFIRDRFAESGLTTNHGPIVAVNSNASNPHYEPTRERTAAIGADQNVLIDMWAKLDEPGSVYYDITWTAYTGELVPEKVARVFEIVKSARKQASDFVIHAKQQSRSIAGYEVDDVARTYIRSEGFEEFFFHRTGHSIGCDIHGTGANMDNLESHDTRPVIANTCFSIEPGIYLPEFGIRSEVNVYVGGDYARVTGEEQQELIRL